MKYLFRFAAAALVAGMATEAAAGHKAANPPVAVVMGQTGSQQTYIPAPGWRHLPAETDSGYSLEVNGCHTGLQAFADDLAGFNRVKQFCDANAKGAARADAIALAASTRLSRELTGLSREEKRDKASRQRDFDAYEQTSADRREFDRATERHAHVGQLAAKMASDQRDLTIDNADKIYRRDVNRRFNRAFPQGVTILPAPIASAAVLGP